MPRATYTSQAAIEITGTAVIDAISALLYRFDFDSNRDSRSIAFFIKRTR